MATGVCYTQSGEVKKYESKLFSYYMAKPMPIPCYFNIYYHDEDKDTEYNYNVINSNLNYPYYYTYFAEVTNATSNKIAWYTFSDITKSEYIDAYQNALVTKYGVNDSYQYAYFPMYAYYSIVPDLSTKISTTRAQKSINTGLNLDYCVIDWQHNGDQNNNTTISRSKLICKDAVGNKIDAITIHINPISYIDFQESSKVWRKEVHFINKNVFDGTTSYIRLDYDNNSVVPWKGYWNTRAMSYLYSYYMILDMNISYLHPLVVMDYKHSGDENGWSRIHIGYVTATINNKYSYYTNGTVFIKQDSSIWEYNHKYSNNFNSNDNNKKYLSCVKDYRHSGDENGNSAIQFTYLNCVF